MTFKDFFEKRLRKNNKPPRQEPAQAQPQEEPVQEKKDPLFKLGNGYYFEFTHVSNGFGGYRPVGLYLLKIDDPTFRRCIVDSNGIIQNFPGIIEGEWKQYLEYPLDKKVRFSFGIYKYKDGKAQVSWTLQPDGRYFEDEDGFGAEDSVEIILYSYLDEDGKFTEPFFRIK